MAAAQASVPQLLAVDALFCGAANFGSEDTNEGCFCGDAGAFVIKKNDVHPALSHCEWFCSSLATAVGVPQVPFNIIRHPDGAYCFGSRWMEGKTKDWWNLALQGAVTFSDLAEDLSRIYAFDLFIHNVDRHANNYMVVPINGAYKVYSFDYSRSWLISGFPPTTVMTDPTCNTVNVKNWLKRNFGDYISINAAFEVLDAIDAISVGQVHDIIYAHPKDWLTQQEEDAIIAWWSNGMASERVETIKIGLNNGTLA